MTDDTNRSPNPIDIHVGRRVRQRRKAMGVTQERLANDLGLTFQQVQKYERGANRVSASKLYEIAVALETTTTYFFEGLADPAGVKGGGVGEPESEKYINEFLMSAEGLELAEMFSRLQSPKLRKRIVELVRTMVEDETD
ncbi:MAG: helix-turn-helix transcriptional regulator [Alphaproteobacteria bacterium]|jgi:transcriptional regulator with XRE-family HTH domain|nr:helix-turn-helix transcriptional regulator [Alphaproteobacteria bacterium]